MSEAFPPSSITIPLVRFLATEKCPSHWKAYNLYLIRDDQVVFYVGQSQCAFNRVWEHIHGGIHGHAVVGRFILVNWPKSSKFSVELLSCHADRFAHVAYNLDASEQSLIEQYTPCFNVSLNSQPAPLPDRYLPPNAPIKYLKSFRRMMHEARYAARHLTDPHDHEWDYENNLSGNGPDHQPQES